MRIFLSFHSKDKPRADALRDAILKVLADATIFYSPISLGQGFWIPKLAKAINEADAFLLLVAQAGVGPWQQVEYHEALDRHIADPMFALVPIIIDGASAPGLSFLRQLNWVELKEPFDIATMQRVVSALAGHGGSTVSPLWQLVQPYRGLNSMQEADADYFFGRAEETNAVLAAFEHHPN